MHLSYNKSHIKLINIDELKQRIMIVNQGKKIHTFFLRKTADTNTWETHPRLGNISLQLCTVVGIKRNGGRLAIAGLILILIVSSRIYMFLRLWGMACHGD